MRPPHAGLVAALVTVGVSVFAAHSTDQNHGRSHRGHAVRVHGKPVQGRVLAASVPPHLRHPQPLRYAWRRCNPLGHGCRQIAGAHHRRYRLTYHDVGRTIRAVVGNHRGVAKRRSAHTPVVSARKNVYVAMAPAGTAHGSSCSAARGVRWLDSRRAWGSRPGRISPGTMVHLCGTIKRSIIARASGTSTAPITFYFEPGASIRRPSCPGRGRGCFDTNGRSYLTIDGGANGSILSTANGTGLAHQNKNVVGIWAVNCDGCTIENLNISDMYVHTAASDTGADDAAGMYVSGSNVTVAHNTMHDDRAAINATWSITDHNISIHNNSIYRVDAGLNSIVNNASGGSIGPILFYRNTVKNFANWDTTGDAYHHDGIHCWTSDHGAAAHYRGFFIYDNVFGGQTDRPRYGDESTSDIFLEGTPDGTPCEDATSVFEVFNNVLTESVFMNNGLLNGSMNAYNNTLIGADTAQGSCAATSGSFVNNVVFGCGTLVYASRWSRVPIRRDHNIYGGSGSNAFSCGGRFIPVRHLAQWRRCVHGDRHSRVLSRSRLLSLAGRGRRPHSRRASTLGSNLAKLCVGHMRALCRGRAGRLRPRSGKWPVGAW